MCRVTGRVWFLTDPLFELAFEGNEEIDVDDNKGERCVPAFPLRLIIHRLISTVIDYLSQ